MLIMDIFTPFQSLADFITYSALGLSAADLLPASLNFFIYDSLKIIALLLVINYLMAIVRHYLPVSSIRTLLTSRRLFGLDYLLAALLGVITPFCSCSSIPLFVGFIGAGIPLGVTLSFLITSPLVNEASLAIFPALFGIKITLLYNLLGIAVGTFGGMFIQKLNMDRFIEPAFLNLKPAVASGPKNISLPLSKLLKQWWSQAWAISQNIIPYVLVGVGLSSLIHGFIPAGYFERFLSGNEFFSVPLAALLGVPLYANSVSVIPVMEALTAKGIPLGTVLAFMTATVTLSIPEALILKKVMKLPLLLTFFGVTVFGIILMGYIFNFLT